MNQVRLGLPAAVRRAILAHAKREYPNECCGFLIGAGGRVKYAAAMRNILSSRVRYRIDDAEHIQLRRLLRGFTPPLSILGVYHSHPNGGARPSPTDIAEAMYDDWLYVIVGLKPSVSVRAFRPGKRRPAPTRRRARRP